MNISNNIHGWVTSPTNAQTSTIGARMESRYTTIPEQDIQMENQSCHNFFHLEAYKLGSYFTLT